MPIIITEGEKKTLALARLATYMADKLRFLPVGIPGVWNWRSRIGRQTAADGGHQDVKGPIPDLSRIEWKGRRVYILFDSDVPRNPSIQAARRQLAAEIQSRGADIFLVDLPNLSGFDKTGADDFLASPEGGPEKLLELIEASAPFKPTLPAGFMLDETGLYAVPDDSGKSPLWICSPLEVRAMTRDAEGNSWGRLLRWRDADGRQHEWAMPMSLLSGDGSELRGKLLDQGLQISPSKSARDKLVVYLQTCKPDLRIECTSQIGWQGDAFVLPDETIGLEAGGRVIFQSEGASGLRQSGTVEEWRKAIGQYCVGNPLLIFAASAALAGPLLLIAGEQSGGFHIVGSSSIGKSTALHVAGSVLGGGGKSGFVQSWRATSNGLEATAEAHNDLTLILDELSQCDPKEAAEVAYMLANGSGKSRATRSGGTRQVKKWRLLFLSAGEISLADHVGGVGRKVHGGQEVRLINIPADAGAGMGIFENLHEFGSGDALAHHLQQVTKEIYGAPLRRFLEYLTRTRKQVGDDLRGFRRDFMTKHLPQGAVGEVSRALARFAVVAAAGELGIGAGVFPWAEGDPTKAAAALFDAWMTYRGTTGAMDLEAAIKQVRRFMELHGESRFQKEGDSRTIINNRAGYLRFDQSGQREYWVMPEVFRTELCSGYDAKSVSKALAERGYLLKDGAHYPVKRVVPEGRLRLYIIRASILLENESVTRDLAGADGALGPQGR
jgi:putative DNA primase/helicase